jgi:hypothetical protein
MMRIVTNILAVIGALSILSTILFVGVWWYALHIMLAPSQEINTASKKSDKLAPVQEINTASKKIDKLAPTQEINTASKKIDKLVIDFINNQRELDAISDRVNEELKKSKPNEQTIRQLREELYRVMEKQANK